MPAATSQTEKVIALVGQIGPLLHGHESQIQGGALADLVAMWLAGHIVLGDKIETAAFREATLSDWIDVVRKLIPVNEAAMLERLRRESH